MIPYLELIIVYTILYSFFINYLNYRQYIKYGENTIPADYDNIIDKETFEQSQNYGQTKLYITFFHSGVSLIINIVKLIFLIESSIWYYSKDILTKYQLIGELSQITLFLIISNAIDLLIDVPFSFYNKFYIEEKFAFNKSTLKLFVSDIIKGQLITICFTVCILTVITYILKWFGEYYYIYLWISMELIGLSMMYIGPTFIQPLFNKLTSLEDGELKTKITKLANRCNFPLKDIQIIDGSIRSNHSNAYFYGFFNNKKIVIYDTMISQFTSDEILAVVAHELGHWYHSHNLKNMIINSITNLLFLTMTSFFINNTDLFKALGYNDDISAGLRIILAYIPLIPLRHILNFISKFNTRKEEYQADEYATKLGLKNNLQDGLIKVYNNNLNSPCVDWLYSMYYYTHPTLIERLTNINRFFVANKMQ